MEDEQQQQQPAPSLPVPTLRPAREWRRSKKPSLAADADGEDGEADGGEARKKPRPNVSYSPHSSPGSPRGHITLGFSRSGQLPSPRCLGVLQPLPHDLLSPQPQPARPHSVKTVPTENRETATTPSTTTSPSSDFSSSNAKVSSRLMEGNQEMRRTVRKIPCEEWFVRLTGYPEAEWRKRKDKHIERLPDGALAVTNARTNQTFRAGTFSLLRLGDLVHEIQSSPAVREDDTPPCLFQIITRADSASIRNVDVAHLQASSENRNAVFQVASNFNGVEAISEGSAPDGSSFTEKYIYDLTQGPAASISAGAAAITRVHAAFYDESKKQNDWTQTSTRQVNFLADLQEHFPTRNGYVVLNGREPDFPRAGTPEYEELFGKVFVGYHHAAQVTTGHRERDTFEAIDDPEQVVDQVFCAAMNIGQGMSGMANKQVPNSRAKCQFILDSDYEATFLSAIKHKREHLFLTLIGGGVFGNSKQGIYEAILKAHQKWSNHPASTLKTVSLVLFSDRDFLESFPSILKQNKIPYRWSEYVRGTPMTRSSFRADE